MVDYEYMKNHYKLIAIDLSRQERLGTDPKAIQQTETRLIISQGSVIVS